MTEPLQCTLAATGRRADRTRESDAIPLRGYSQGTHGEIS